MCYAVNGCNVQCTCYTEHRRYGLSCLYAESVESMSSAGSVWYVWYVYGLYGILEFKLCCEILLLLNMVDRIDIRLWSKQCRAPCSLSVYE